MHIQTTATIAAALVVAGGTLATAHAATWTRAYVRTLPDSAFAVVERRADGARLPRLPHHDATGALDIPHLCSALGRIQQVKWVDQTSAERARAHLATHLAEAPAAICRPGTRGR